MKSEIFICFLFAVSVLSSCNSAQKVDDGVEVIAFDGFRRVDDAFSDVAEYVILKNDDNPVMMLSDISQIKILNGRIYVVDANPRPDKIVEFDMEGNPLRAFSKRGRGPGEYMQITDFDITADGRLYVLDGQSDRMSVYDSDFSFVSSVDVPVELDFFSMLGGGGFLVEYSSWARDRVDDIQVAVVDANLMNPQAITHYGVVDDNFWLSDSYFVSTDAGIFHHRQVSDEVRLLSPVDGRVLRHWHFDFGSHTVPEEDKTDIENKTDDYKGYVTPIGFTIITDRHIYGGLFDRGERKQYIVDRQNNEISFLPAEFGQLAGAVGDTLVCSLDISVLDDSVSFPAEVTAALEAGDFVLALHRID